MDEHVTEDWIRTDLFGLMINHYLVVVGNDGRVHPRLRRGFFRRVAEHYRRYLPSGGYARPGGVAGLKHRLVARDSYVAYKTLRRAHRLAGSLRPASPAGAAPGGDGPQVADAPASDTDQSAAMAGRG
ncbi:hypothetical protein MCAG_04657 [Micromonospora sp. ATCC 39149]|nr:hypothetical protein MCAG_04657 [Micromonospora sp. ATCC 39149]